MSEHDEGAHALLSPSSSERWLSCPASVRLAESLPTPPEGPYAAEGTAAHALAEAVARATLLDADKSFDYRAAWREAYPAYVESEGEMIEYAKAYATLLGSILDATPNGVLMLEQRLPTGVPQSWGTSDAVIVSPTVVHIVDYKYGMGVFVDPEGNSQLRLYGVGALEAYGSLLGDVEVVQMTVFQPRIEHVATAMMTAADLIGWRDSIIPTAELALSDNAPFGPSEDACRFCPARGQCSAQTEWATRQDFAAPDLMNPDQLAQALTVIPQVEQWCAAVRETALRLAYEDGTDIPGFKVVLSNGRRSITDEVGALAELIVVQGYEPEQVTTSKPKGIGELEKLMGKAEFAKVMAPYVSTSEGKPSLVPEDDKRPAIDREGAAAKDFG